MATLNGTNGNDTLVGTSGNDTIFGNSGNDWVEGGAGNDQLSGGSGQDSYVFREFGAANADSLANFDSGWDNLQLDAAAFAAIGATGRFSAGDVRFFAGTAAHDADDRIIFNSSTGQLFYDADGSGSGAAQLIATVAAGSGIAATDINVFGTPTPTPTPTPSGVITGTAGNDSLVGTSGNDTIDGGPGADTMQGAGGDDTYIVDNVGDVIIEQENGGTDVAQSSVSYTLGGWVNDLILTGTAPISGTGNAVENHITGNVAANVLDGGLLVDTLTGGGGADSFNFSVAPGAADADLITDFASGIDKIHLDARVMGALGTTGNFVAGDARFFAGASAHDADDRVIFNSATGQLWYDADGNGAGAAQLIATVTGNVTATDIAVDNGTTVTPSPTPTPTPTPIPAGSIVGTSGNDNISGTNGADSIFGLGGNDTIFASGGDDWVQGGTGNDSISGGSGQDRYAFAEYGAANADQILNFGSGWDSIHLDAAGFANIGATGRFSPGDVRFYSAAGATAGHDADDRIIYNASNGQLFYDADGSGAGQAQLIATFQDLPGMVATDINVFGTPSPTPTPSGVITGTSGNDSLVGTSGNDTIDGGPGADTMRGADGDDTYIVDNPGDVIIEQDNGGTDVAQSSVSYTLGGWVNDLILTGSAAIDGTGNDLANHITGNSAANVITGGAGVDTLIGGGGADSFAFAETGAANADTITDFTSGTDKIHLDASVMAALGTGGNFAAGDARFFAGTAAHDADDRVIFNSATGQLWYDADGNGANAAQLIATVTGNVVATDIAVDNGSAPPTGQTFHNLQEVGIPPLSGQYQIDSLLADYYVAWDRTTSNDHVMQYTFSVTEGTKSGYAYASFDANEEAATRQALAEVTSITGIQFQEVSNGNDAELHFAHESNNTGFSGVFDWTQDIELDASGHLTSYTADGYVLILAGLNVTDPYNYQILLHEIGHSLGLKHPHDPTLVLLQPDDDNHHTVMTYQNIYPPVDHFQPYDVAALQWLYGTDGLGGHGAYADGAQPQVGGDGNDSLVGTGGADYLDGWNGSDTLIGGAGNDFLIGGGNDVLNGGDGDDRYRAYTGDTLIDSGGNDTVYTYVDWTLAPGFENLVILDNSGTSPTGRGNDLSNLISGGNNNERLIGLGGNDTIYGRAGNDTIDMSPGPDGSWGNDTVDGGAGIDTLDFSHASSGVTIDLGAGTASGGGGTISLTGIENVIGSPFADSIRGLPSNIGSGANVFAGGGGQDTITGGQYGDTFFFAVAPGFANAELIIDFNGTATIGNQSLDVLRFDGSAFTRLGATDFTSGDARFYAAAGATSGHDSTDRVVYDTSTGNLYYDADGNGAGASLLVATLQGAPALDGSQIDVVNGQPDASVNLTGTSGNDSLVGGDGNDTLNGLGGNDTLVGFGGDDYLDGGDGNDQLEGGAGADTLNGGLGDDTYLDPMNDVIVDAGGNDTVVVLSGSGFAFPDSMENLIVRGPATSSDPSAVGNANDNRITIETSDRSYFIDGRGGNDTIIGGGAGDRITVTASSSPDGGHDVVDGGGGSDILFVNSDPSGAVIDFQHGTVTSRSGSTASTATFTNMERAYGTSYDDVLIASDAGGNELHGTYGNDTLLGGAGNDFLDGDGFFDAPADPLGNDSLVGGAGDDTLTGGRGNDTLDGGTGNDALTGGNDNDVFRFSAAPGAGSADVVSDFQSGIDHIQLDPTVMTALGASGTFASGDARFWTGASAHDADDRVVYDSSTGNLWYDADGSGATSAQLIATLQGAPALAAPDIVVGAFVSGQVTGTAGDDSLVGSAGNDTLDGQGGNDTLNGQEGGDLLLGGAGNDVLDGGGQSGDRDTLSGGLGNDTLTGSTYLATYLFDVAPGAANADVITDVSLYNASITLDGRVFANIGPSGNFLNGDERFYAAAGATSGHDATDRVILDTAGKALYYDADGDGAGAAQLIATLPNLDVTYGLPAPAIHVVNGDTNMVLQGGYGDTTLQGGPGDDSIYGGFSAETMDGGAGNDLLVGGGGADLITGGAGSDSFLFGYPYSYYGGTASITDFVSGADHIQLDGSGLVSTGPAGDFSAGDERFYAAAGATAAHDATDRIVYDTSTGNVWYDDDGTGQDAATLLFTVPAGTTVAATDFAVINASTDAVIIGTAGNDSIVGGSGHDTISGGDGNDTISGGAGSDSIDGGAGDDSLDGGVGNDTVAGGAGNDYLSGGSGLDLLQGGDGNDTLETSFYYTGEGPDTLDGGLGDDTYLVNSKYSGQDIFVDAGGIDTVDTYVGWTLGPGMENLILRIADESGIPGTGNELNNVIRSVTGYKGTFTLDGADGNDTLIGGGNPDVFLFQAGSGNYGNDVIDGGGDADTIAFSTWQGSYETSGATIDLRHGTVSGGMTSGSATFVNVEDATGGDFNDRLIAHDGMTYVDNHFGETITRGAYLDGRGGDDTLEGGASNDRLTGGAGADVFLFTAAPGDASADALVDFASGSDKIWLDANVMSALGASGAFATNDARFYAAAGATSGHDADDRVVFDTTTGKLYYDADGAGAAGSLLIATVNNGGSPFSPIVGTVAAPDIVVLNGGTPGLVVTGTANNDSLTGGPGDDTLNGLDGNDTLNGGAGADSMVGGNGDDLYIVDNAGDVLVEQVNGGIDEARSSVSYTLPEWVNNLTLTGSAVSGTGNTVENLITGNGASNVLSGMDGADTLAGGVGNDTLTGGAGNDTFVFNVAPGAANADRISDFTSATDTLRLDGSALSGIGSSGRFSAGDVRFYAAAGAANGHDADDRVVYNTSTGELYYDADGSGSGVAQLIATLNGAPALATSDLEVVNGTPTPTPTPTAGQNISGTNNADTLVGGSGNDTIFGNSGSDWIEGRGGNDQLSGGSGQDSYVFREFGAANADTLANFDSGWDALRFDSAAFTGLGGAGHFSANDARFYAAAGATGGHDADDRMVFNTSSGQLYYDPDGAGGGAAQLVATVPGGSGVAAGDIWVV